MRAGLLTVVAITLLFAGSSGAQLTGAGLGQLTLNAQATTLPDLTIDMAILGDPPTVTPGQTIPYAFVVTNNGAATPAGSRVLVQGELHDQVAYLSATEGARGQMPFFLGVTCSFVAPVVTCELPASLAAGDHFVVRLDVELSSSATGGNLVSQVRVDPLAEVDESSENNNKDKVKVRIQP